MRVKREETAPAFRPSSSMNLSRPIHQHHLPYLAHHHPPPAEQSSLAHAVPLLPPIAHPVAPTDMQQPPPQYAAPAPMNGAPMSHHPPYRPTAQYAPQYHGHNGVMQPLPSNALNGQSGMMRYAAIPPQASLDARQLTGTRNKKEIKRRTKTGCLTCRKRRIKCDETQPHCRNCAKSKRECLGYDPIFKPQQTGPAAIAAKPETTPLQSATTPESLPTNSYQAPHGYHLTTGALMEYGASLDPALSGDHVAAQNNYGSARIDERKPSQLTMDDLFSLNDVPPQYQKRESPPPLLPGMQQEITEFYMYHFAVGLNKLFETDWYTTQGLNVLYSNTELQDFVSQCVDQFKSSSDASSVTAQIRSLEARLVWQLATMPRQGSGDTTLIARTDTLEALLTGQTLDAARISPPPQSADASKYNEQTFWHNLGRLVSVRDATEANSALDAMRGILRQLESRDVLYSVAVARHIGGRSSPLTTEDAYSLKVAQTFVETEDQRGTTQVIQRICSMALRGWVLRKR